MREKVLLFIRDYLEEYLTEKEISDLLELIAYETEIHTKRVGVVGFVAGFIVALLITMVL